MSAWSEGAADVDGADDEGDARDQAGMHELGVLDPIRAHVTRHTGRHEPDYTIGAVNIMEHVRFESKNYLFGCLFSMPAA